MRPRFLLLAALLLLAGCGSSAGKREQASSPPQGTLNGILEQAGEDVGLTEGTSDYAPGPLRLSFLVIKKDGKPVFRPTARVWVASGLDAHPFARATAALEPVGVPGVSEHAAGDITRIYVAHLTVPRPGKFWVVAEPVGGPPIQAVGNLIVRKRTAAPSVGDRAIPSKTPTISSTGGNFKALTTRVPPDKGLLRYSVARSLAARKPFVLVFATPKFCTSRTCGPVVDVVDAVRRRSAETGIRFIHVEIYKDNDPSLGVNRWVKEWRLPTEPWIFLVGRDGRIKATFEGSVSPGELAAAVARQLT